MKQIIIFCCILCTLLFTSCKKNKPGNASFTSGFDFTTTIPAMNINIDTTIVVSSDISITDDRLQNCDRASLRSLYIEIVEPSGQTFDFCNEVHFWLSAPGIPETDVVSITNINPSTIRIDFNVNSMDLAQFVRQSSMTARVKIRVKKGFANPIKIKGNIVFNVQAKLA
jgi:hypothetical protein